MNVLHTLGLSALRRRPANAPAERNAYAGDLPLKRPQHQFFVAIEVKARPVQIIELGVEKRRKLRRIGDEIALVGQ